MRTTPVCGTQAAQAVLTCAKQTRRKTEIQKAERPKHYATRSAYRNRTATLRSSWNTQGVMVAHPFISVPARLSRLALVSFSPRHLFKALSDAKKHPTPHGTEQFNNLERSDLANLRHMRVPLIRVTTVRVEQGLGVTPIYRKPLCPHGTAVDKEY